PQRENAAVRRPLPSAAFTFVAPYWRSNGLGASGRTGSSGHAPARGTRARSRSTTKTRGRMARLDPDHPCVDQPTGGAVGAQARTCASRTYINPAIAYPVNPTPMNGALRQTV